MSWFILFSNSGGIRERATLSFFASCLILQSLHQEPGFEVQCLALVRGN